MQKIPVTVELDRFTDGTAEIRSIILGNGRYFRVRRVLHYAAASDGNEGVRFTVLIGHSEKYIYKAGDKWYVVREEG